MSDQPLNPIRSVLNVLWSLVTGTLRMPDGRVGEKVLTDDGRPFFVYRETTVRPTSETTHQPGAVLAFNFHLWFMPGPVVPYAVRVFEPLSILTTPFFAGLPGFRTKLWLFDHDTGDYQGIYQWETTRDAERYAQALARLMKILSMPGSVSYDVVDDTSLDEYVAARSPETRTETSSSAQWLRRVAGSVVLSGLLVLAYWLAKRTVPPISKFSRPSRRRASQSWW